MKKCGKCKIIKSVKEFGIDNRRRDRLKPYCKKCRNSESDKKKEKKRKQLWYLNNREIILQRSSLRQIVKRDERNDYLKRYYKKNSHLYAWRSLVYRTIIGKIKESDSLTLLGYSATDLKNHLSSLFTQGMTWNNYGEWHIDHIEPISSFNDSTPINIVNSLSNLQPLWKTTREINGTVYVGNLNKGNCYGKDN